MSKWQTIDTAPRDGTKVDLAVFNLGREPYCDVDCYYDPDLGKWVDQFDDVVEMGDWRAYAWMPATSIPQPPVQS